jgi:hypothetical protein
LLKFLKFIMKLNRAVAVINYFSLCRASNAA